MTVPPPQPSLGIRADLPETEVADAGDALHGLGRHLAAVWSSVHQYAVIAADEAVGGLYHFLIVAASVVIALYTIVLLMSLGGYFLVSGIALGLGGLAGSPWLGRALAGVLFLIGPVALGLAVLAVMRSSRERRLAIAYRRRRSQGSKP